MRMTFALAAALTLLAATQANAHARLLHASPRVGETVARSPGELRLLFSESIDLPASSVTLAGADGRLAPTGRLALDPKDHRVVIVPLPTPLAAGAYRVRWAVRSEDTHDTDGDYGFRVGP